MKTHNDMQLKALINNRAKALSLSPQQMLQQYIIERILVRLSASPWRNMVVIKGGVLISSLVGEGKRSTKDLDTTIRGFDLTHENALKVFREICALESDDDFTLSVTQITDIREADEYPGVRVHIKAEYGKISTMTTIDVTTGARIIPGAIDFEYKLMFEDKIINLLAYPITTVLAEKVETVISRGITNTRPRDYYDIRLLWLLYQNTINPAVFKQSLVATSQKRGSIDEVRNFSQIMDSVSTDKIMQNRWNTYKTQYSYVGDLTLEESCKVVKEIMNSINWQ